MADWEDEFMGGGGATTGAWDDDGDWGQPQSNAVTDDWENADDWETEAKPEKSKTQIKKTLKQIAKEKEEEEKKAREAKQKKIDDERRQLEQDPQYRLKLKEQQKAQIEQSELDMISDLFGPSTGSSKEEYRQEANPERARQLAALTGLGDGADGGAVHGKTDWDDVANEKGDKKAAPNPLDTIPFTTDAEVDAFTKLLARKIKDVGVAKTTNNSQSMSKVLLLELIRTLGPDMKSTDVDEVLRVTTVVKNDLTKKTQNVKKNKNKKGIKLHDNGRDYSDEEFM